MLPLSTSSKGILLVAATLTDFHPSLHRHWISICSGNKPLPNTGSYLPFAASKTDSELC